MAHQKCCAQHVNAIWDFLGGPENIIRYEDVCFKCKHYIGLTYTSKEDATKYLQQFELELANKK